MRLIDADALDEAFTTLRFNEANELQHWGDRKDWCLYGHEIETLIKSAPTIEAELVKRGQWIPIKTRPMDEEERREWSEKLGYDLEDSDAVIFTSLPDDGQTVLTSNRYGHVCVDIFCNDEDGCYFEDNGDMDGILAWMPLPEPYHEAKMEEQE